MSGMPNDVSYPIAVVLGAIAFLSWPSARWGIVRSAPGRTSGARLRIPAPAILLEPARQRITVFVASACAATAGVAISIPVAIALMIASGLAVALATSALRGRAASAAAVADLSALSALAAELRAGQPMDDALRAVSDQAATGTGRDFQAAARAVSMGGDPVRVLRGSASPIARGISEIWELSDATGCPLADAVDGVERDARARHAQRDRLRALLAGPRATAGLLAALPLLGIAMGGAIGADPLYVLAHSPIGGILLIAGTSLIAAGVLWMRAIVQHVEHRA